MSKNRKINKAFTLFEVLISLAILSIAMVAGMVTTDAALNRTVAIEKTILAHWVGMNIINSMELKLLKIKLSDADLSTDSGTLTMRNQDFNWQLKTTKKIIDAEDLLNIEVLVYDAQSKLVDKVSRNVFIN